MMSRTLYYLPLSAASRKVRLALAEKSVIFNLEVEKIWERRPEFLVLNPACDVPVLIEADGSTLAEGQAICEYLEETYPNPGLLGSEALARAEVRRIVFWFDRKFDEEVTHNLVGEKFFKRLMGWGDPSGSHIRAGLINIHYHLDYIGHLADHRKWLAGDDFSLADITAAAHLSAIDYLGDVPWEEHHGAKDWYVRVKSRPSFRALLADQVRGLPAAAHYADLDF